VVFTAVDDDSVGSVVWGYSDGVVGPGDYFGSTMLEVNLKSPLLQQMRFSHATNALHFPAKSGARTLRNIQFAHCIRAIVTEADGNSPITEIRLNNVLFSGISNGVFTSGIDSLAVRAEHLTVSQCAGGFVVLPSNSYAGDFIATNSRRSQEPPSRVWERPLNPCSSSSTTPCRRAPPESAAARCRTISRP